MRKTALILIAILFWLVTSEIHAQTHHFEAFIGKHKVGEVVATKSNEGDKTKLQVVTNVKAHAVVMTVTVKVENHAIYQDNVLIESEATSYENGDLHSSTTIKKVNSGYSIKTMDASKSHSSPINFSGSWMYFKEPKGVEHSFSETLGENFAIENLGNSKYRVHEAHSSKGNEYTYVNGKLTHVEIHHALYSVILKSVR